MRGTTHGDSMESSAPNRLIERIVSTLSSEIRSGLLAPGHKLNQERLANRFQVSRTPIREALLALKTEGLVNQQGQSSVTVRKSSVRDLAESLEIVIALVTMSAPLAAARINDEKILRLRDRHTRLVKSVSKLKVAFSRSIDIAPAERRARLSKTAALARQLGVAKLRFHATLTVVVGNRTLKKMTTPLLKELVSQHRTLDIPVDFLQIQEEVALQVAVIDALDRRDGTSARVAMARYLDGIAKTLRQSLRDIE